MFDKFWPLYPRKVGKLAALKAWERALQHDTAENIITGLQAQLPAMQATEKQFVPHPTTWLNQGRWMDEIETAPTHQRAYNDWTDAEKQREAAYVAEKGIDHAVRAGMLRSDIERLTNEGYLGPGKVAL